MRIDSIMGMLLLATSCQPPEPLPEGILGHNAMVELMLDVHLVEGARTGVTISNDSLGIDAYHRTVMLNHGLDSIGYQKNFRYYSARPEEFERIFSEVIERLTVMQSEMGR